MPKAIDLTGQKFGRLTVIRKVDSYSSKSGKHKDTRWLCRCSCSEHNEVIVTRGRLKNGVTKSCGCIRKEMTIERNIKGRRTNKYDLSGEFGIGYTSKGEQFWFDLDDYEKLADLCWHYDVNGYLMSNISDENGRRKTVALHRLLLPDPPDGYVVDHRIHPADSTGLKHDNRKKNLRYVTLSQNAQNQVPLRLSNSSGHKGVSWNKGGMWRASISANRKRHTKYFKADEYEKACEWYDRMAEKLHGEYRFSNDREEAANEKPARER